MHPVPGDMGPSEVVSRAGDITLGAWLVARDPSCAARNEPLPVDGRAGRELRSRARSCGGVEKGDARMRIRTQPRQQLPPPRTTRGSLSELHRSVFVMRRERMRKLLLLVLVLVTGLAPTLARS